MQTLMTVIMTWLSLNFGLPATSELPTVEFVPAAKMLEVRYERLERAKAERTALPDFGRHFHAVYDDRSRTIYLPEGWTAATPAEVSILVHEMVHHLQNVADLTYACAAAREKPAYQAQARWLEHFDKNLEDEFDIDAMTILVRTNCMR